MSNASKKDKGFCLFYDWVDDLDHLRGADAWKIIKALCDYYRYGINPVEQVSGALKTTVSIMFHQIQRKEAISAQRAQNAAETNKKKKDFACAERTQSERNADAERAQEDATNTNTNTNTNTGISPLSLTRARDNAKPYGEFGNVYLTEREYTDLKERYGAEADKLIALLSAKVKAKGYSYDDHYAALLLWAAQDGIKRADGCEENQKSYDLDDFFEAAVNRSFEDFKGNGK